MGLLTFPSNVPNDFNWLSMISSVKSVIGVSLTATSKTLAPEAEMKMKASYPIEFNSIFIYIDDG